MSKLGKSVLQKQKLSLGKPIEEKVEVKKAEAVESRGFAGFKAQLKADIPGLSVNIPVRWQRLSDKYVKEKMNIIYRTTDGKIAEHKYVDAETGAYRKSMLVWIDEEGKIRQKDEVHSYQKLPSGEEVPVEPFEMTHEFNVQKLISSTKMEEYLPSDYYEIWSGETGSLWHFGKYLRDSDQAAVIEFTSRKGFDRYYGVIYPRTLSENKFVLEMMTTRSIKKYGHEMEAGMSQVQKIEAKKAQSTLDFI